MENIELTTMCAVIKDKYVLMINRIKSWPGWAFPGGHLERGESMEECVRRELLEEAGIHLGTIQLKGIANIYNNKTHKRHIIFNYNCKQFQEFGWVRCNEGNFAWIRIEDIEKISLAEGMQYRIPLFLSDEYSELYVEWNEEEGYTKINYLGE